MAESEWGVACHKKINNVGKNTVGCLTAFHNWIKFCFQLSSKLGPAKAKLVPFATPITGCSFTRTATADVSSGSKAVTPKTNLKHQKLQKRKKKKKDSFRCLWTIGNYIPIQQPYVPYTISIHQGATKVGTHNSAKSWRSPTQRLKRTWHTLWLTTSPLHNHGIYNLHHTSVLTWFIQYAT